MNGVWWSPSSRLRGMADANGMWMSARCSIRSSTSWRLAANGAPCRRTLLPTERRSRFWRSSPDLASSSSIWTARHFPASKDASEAAPGSSPACRRRGLANIELSERVFGWHESGRLYTWLNRAENASGVAIPPGIAFHIFRHTYCS